MPLMTPALAVVAIYALLLAWNDYLYQFVLLSSTRNMTVSVTQATLFDDVDAPWNAMMAAAILYALPPVALFFGLRRYIAAGLTMGDVRGREDASSTTLEPPSGLNNPPRLLERATRYRPRRVGTCPQPHPSDATPGITRGSGLAPTHQRKPAALLVQLGAGIGAAL
jgi:hypothetical protein